MEDKRPGQRVVVSLLRRELPIVERSGERKLLECDARGGAELEALPDAEISHAPARALPDAA